MRHVAESLAYIPTRQAYRAFLDHAQGCTDCAAPEGGRCATAQRLWQSYRELRGRSTIDRGRPAP